MSKQTAKTAQKAKATNKKQKITEAVTPAATQEELKELETIEQQIKEGIIKYYETGMLLQKINDEGLYKLRGYKTFKDYCDEVFHFSRSYGYRLIAYCKVWNLLKDDAKDKIPERLIRSLTTLKDPKEIQSVWNKAKKQAKGELPDYKTVESEVKNFKHIKKEKKLIAEFGECNDGSVFCLAINKKIDLNNAAAELITGANKNLRQLLMAIREIKDKITLDDTIKSALKKEVFSLQKQQIESLFSDEEESE